MERNAAAPAGAGSRDQAAGRKDSPGDPPRAVQVVEFLLGKDAFAIDLFNVREVVEYRNITRLPDTPSYIRGIIDLRGEITTIVDLRERLRIPHEDTEGDRRIIVLDDSITRYKTGILVDNVTSVSTFDHSEVDTGTGAVDRRDSAVVGIIKKKVRVKDRDENQLLILIDIRRLISDEEIGAVVAAGGAAGIPA